MIRLKSACLAALALASHLSGPSAAQDEASVLPKGALADAVDVLERRTGARTLEIRLADEAGAPVFEAAMSRENELIYMRLEAPSEDVVAIEIAELPEWMADYTLHAYMKSLDKARVPLTEAIAKAEQKANAAAVGAGLAEPLSGRNAVLAYYVEVLKGRRSEVLAVDATRGSFIANPEALYGHWTPVKLARRLASL